MIDVLVPLRVEYDPDADAAYIYLQREIAAGEAVSTVIAIDETESTSMVNLDLDTSERLLGVDVLDASTRLPVELLRALGATHGASAT
ncbi:MAG: DUF2283 domain-containing protein [Actinomycetes bacterium]